MTGLEIAGVPLAVFAGLAVITAIAAALQRLSGQGFGTILAGFTALAAPEQIPAAVLLLGLVSTLLGAGLAIRDIRWREIAPAVAGRLAGTVPAVWLVALVAGSPALGVAVALVILLGVGLSLVGIKIRKTDRTLFAAGALSGFMATLTSTGAAPMTLIYQDDAAKAARGTLNLFFLLGLLFSIGGLAAKGLVTASNLGFAATLAPAAVVGVFAVAPLARRMANLRLRPLALGLAALAAVLLLGENLL